MINEQRFYRAAFWTGVLSIVVGLGLYFHKMVAFVQTGAIPWGFTDTERPIIILVAIGANLLWLLSFRYWHLNDKRPFVLLLLIFMSTFFSYIYYLSVIRRELPKPQTGV